MATSMNCYEKLYNNMKARFTVVNGDSECSLGEYMLMKAGKKKESSALPIAAATLRQPTAIVSFVNYMNDKLMVKAAPQKDKVMRAFPFRTAAAAILSALLVCTFVVTYSATALNTTNQDTGSSYMAVSEDAELEQTEQENGVN